MVPFLFCLNTVGVSLPVPEVFPEDYRSGVDHIYARPAAALATTHATECQTENIDSIATIKALEVTDQQHMLQSVKRKTLTASLQSRSLEVTDQQHMLQSVKRKTLTASLQSRHWKWPTNNTCYRVSNGKHWQHHYNQGTGSDRPTTHATECQTENIDSIATIKALEVTDQQHMLQSVKRKTLTASLRSRHWKWPTNNTCYRVSNGKHWQHRYDQGTGSDRPTTHATECQTENIDSIATIKALEVTDQQHMLQSVKRKTLTASLQSRHWKWPTNNTCYRVSNGKHWQHHYNQGTGSDRPTTHATECQTENIDSIATIKALEVTDQQHMLQSVKRKTLTASLQSRHWKWPTNNTCYRVSNGKHWQHRYNQGTGSDRPTTHATECQTENIDSIATIKALEVTDQQHMLQSVKRKTLTASLQSRHWKWPTNNTCYRVSNGKHWQHHYNQGTGSDRPTTGCHRSEARKWNFQAEGGCFLFLPIHCFRQ